MKQHLRRLLAAVGTLAMLTTAASALSVEQAVDLLEEYYVDDLPQAAYEAETLDELFAAVGDPYTFYMTEEEYQAFLGSVEGSEEQVGIGVAVSYTDAGIEINTVLPGGAAEAGGLVAGDVIIAIDGESCVPAKESDVTRIAARRGLRWPLRSAGRREHPDLPAHPQRFYPAHHRDGTAGGRNRLHRL